MSSANGNDGNRGDDPTRALATIGQAQTNGVAGDGIIIDPRSSLVENVVITKNNLTIISAASLIGGRDRATIEPASGIPLRVTTGIGFTAIGMRFFSADTAAAASQEADGYSYVDCDFQSTTGIGLRLLPVDATYTASEGRVLGGSVRDCGSDGISLEGSSGGVGVTTSQILGVSFWGNTDRDIQTVPTAASPAQDIEVGGCVFHTRNKTVYITATTTDDRLKIFDSWFAVDSGRLTSTQVALATACVCMGLYDATGLVDTSAF